MADKSGVRSRSAEKSGPTLFGALLLWPGDTVHIFCGFRISLQPHVWGPIRRKSITSCPLDHYGRVCTTVQSEG